MHRILYVVGAAILMCGVALMASPLIPAISVGSQLSVLKDGASLLLNGVALLLSGLAILCLARLVHFVNRVSTSLARKKRAAELELKAQGSDLVTGVRVIQKALMAEITMLDRKLGSMIAELGAAGRLFSADILDAEQDRSASTARSNDPSASSRKAPGQKAIPWRTRMAGLLSSPARRLKT